MTPLLNGIYLLATVLFVSLVYIQTLRTAPEPDRRPDWPLRHFWPSDRFRHVALAFAGVSAVGMVVMVMGGATGVDRTGILPLLLAAGIALVVLGAACLTYSIMLYWQPSARETDGF